MAGQWLGLCAFTAKGLGSVPGQGTKIPQAAQPKKKRKKILLIFHRPAEFAAIVVRLLRKELKPWVSFLVRGWGLLNKGDAQTNEELV